MGSTVVSCFLALLSSRGSTGFSSTLFGTVCLVGMLASTRIGNVPINNRVLEMDPERDQEEFVRLRERCAHAACSPERGRTRVYGLRNACAGGTMTA